MVPPSLKTRAPSPAPPKGFAQGCELSPKAVSSADESEYALAHDARPVARARVRPGAGAGEAFSPGEAARITSIASWVRTLTVAAPAQGRHSRWARRGRSCWAAPSCSSATSATSAAAAPPPPPPPENHPPAAAAAAAAAAALFVVIILSVRRLGGSAQPRPRRRPAAAGRRCTSGLTSTGRPIRQIM